MKKKIRKIYLNPKDFMDQYFNELKRCLEKLDKNKVTKVIELLIGAYENEKSIFIIGNGGSAATASHMACDLGKGTLQRIYDNKEKRFRVVSLTDNVALMTALANDLSFDDVFVQQLRNLIQKGDIVIVLSGSGNSINIIKAVKYAKLCKAKTIGILGFKDGGKVANIVDYPVIVNSNHYGPVEDIQLIINHLIASWIAKIKNTQDGKKGTTSNNKAIPFKR